MVGQKGKMFKFLKKLWSEQYYLKGKGFELWAEPPQRLQAQALTVTVSLFTMHLHTTRFTITINTTYPYERATVPHVPYLDLNTDKKDQRMTKISFNLRQPMLIYAIDACASGFLYKML